jgi:hypothetical protein
MFIATHFINLECALLHMSGPDMHDFYLAMTCTMMLLMMLFKYTKNLCVYFKNKKKLRCAYKYLSRMKLALLLSKWWHADNVIRYKNRTQKRVQQSSL